MSLIERKPISVGRAARKQRDDRFFLVATEDTTAPEEYFAHLRFHRAKVIPFPTEPRTGHSSPRHVVDRLKYALGVNRAKIRDGDEFWVLIDCDHHFEPGHIAGSLEALRDARKAGIQIAISNPCFCVWLLLHHREITSEDGLSNCEEVERALGTAVPGYGRKGVKAGEFPQANVAIAIQRARILEKRFDDAEQLWPKGIGTQIYRLLERLVTPE